MTKVSNKAVFLFIIILLLSYICLTVVSIGIRKEFFKLLIIIFLSFNIKERETGLEYWACSKTPVNRRVAGLSFLFVPFLYPLITIHLGHLFLSK